MSFSTITSKQMSGESELPLQPPLSSTPSTTFCSFSLVSELTLPPFLGDLVTLPFPSWTSSRMLDCVSRTLSLRQLLTAARQVRPLKGVSLTDWSRQSAALEGLDEEEINSIIDHQRMEEVTARSFTATSENDAFRATHTNNLL